MSVATPADLFGPLFSAVQDAHLFPDSKTFADAVPRRPVAEILADWTAQAPAGDALVAFVAANFDVPAPPADTPPSDLPLADHLHALWPVLTRNAVAETPGSSALPLPRRYVAPGGRFRELYYWDSYFTMLGLARSGRHDLIEDMIADFGSLIDAHGHIPNGTRSYYLSRSHPPVFHLMTALSQDRAPDARRRRLGWMRREHAFWMAGEALAPGTEHRRVVRLADRSLLNRYWDDRPAPRDESWREDIALAAAAPDRDAPDLWRNMRAAAESGWDFSTRWLGDRRTLATIRTTRLLPIDLNCLLHSLEATIAAEAAALDDSATAAAFAARADARRAAITTHLWHEDGGFHADHDLDTGRVSDLLTGAAPFALFAGLATPAQAPRVAGALHTLLHDGGLAVTANASGQQWDAPNGWAPLQWIAIAGLRAYGENAFANEIAARWLRMVEAHYRATGQMLEKYDVVQLGAGGGGEYGTETGFGWTNGVTLELLAATD